MHQVRVAGGGEVAEQRGERDAAGAEPDGVDVVAAGDVAGDVDRLEDSGRVGVEVPVALLGGRVAPAHREVRDAGGDGALDQAATGREVGDVVLVDLGGHDDERPRVDLRRRLVVLDQLEHVAAVHDVAGRDREVAADLEGSGVDLRRHPAVVTKVVREVPGPGDDALSAGLRRPSPSRWGSSAGCWSARSPRSRATSRSGRGRGSWRRARRRRSHGARRGSRPGRPA